MVESQTLQITQQAGQLNDLMVKYVCQHLVEKGYTSITPSLLSFLSVLDCGVNYGSEIARTLGVSRQMVAKTVKELSQLGYLEQLDGTGKQKEIVFTLQGEKLISDARKVLAETDKVLCDALGEKTLQAFTQQLDQISGLVSTL